MTGTEAADWLRAFLRRLTGLVEPPRQPASVFTVTLKVGARRPQPRST